MSALKRVVEEISEMVHSRMDELFVPRSDPNMSVEDCLTKMHEGSIAFTHYAEDAFRYSETPEETAQVLAKVQQINKIQQGSLRSILSKYGSPSKGRGRRR